MVQADMISLGRAGTASLRFQHSASFDLPLSTLVEQLKAGIDGAGLWLLHEINPQSIVSRDGYGMEAARQLLFFHPRYMARLLAADRSALIEAPLKFAILEADGRCEVRWFDPVLSFSRYENAALTELGRELAKKCDAIIGAAGSRA